LIAFRMPYPSRCLHAARSMPRKPATAAACPLRLWNGPNRSQDYTASIVDGGLAAML